MSALSSTIKLPLINIHPHLWVSLCRPAFDCSHKEACFSGVRRLHGHKKPTGPPFPANKQTHTHIRTHTHSSLRLIINQAAGQMPGELAEPRSSELHRDWVEMFCELYSDWCSWLCIGILLNRGERERGKSARLCACVSACACQRERGGGGVGMATQLLLKQATETNSSVKICVQTCPLEARSCFSAIKC